ncbi:hypothetical protein V8G54_037648, partial [Vigna mungo]
QTIHVTSLARVFPRAETYTRCRSHIYIDRATLYRCDHTSTNAPDPIRTPQVKHGWARVVLGWVTSWEVLVLHLFFTFFSFLRCFSSFLFPTKSQSTDYTTPTNSYYGFFGPKPSISLRSPASSQVLKLIPAAEAIYTFIVQHLTGVIRPALMHRIPSELC